MKKLILILSLTAAAPAFADFSLAQQNKVVAQINQLQTQGNLSAAIDLSVESSYAILQDIHAEETVASVDSRLDEIRQQVVTQTYSAGGAFSLLFHLLSGEGSYTRHMTQILTVNPEQVAAFPGRVSADFRQLQSDLAHYVKSNESAIVYAKSFAAKAMQLSLQLPAADMMQVAPVLEGLVQKVQVISFLGTQSVGSCIHTNYADVKDSEGFSISGLLLSFSLQDSIESAARTEVHCSKPTSQQIVVQDVQVSSYRTLQLDTIVAGYAKQLGLAEVEDARAPLYPTWGSPYYSN